MRLEEKKRKKDEKALAKQLKLEEKRRVKEEKKLQKQVKIDEKKLVKKEKKITKKIENNNISQNTAIFKSTNFEKLVEKITKKNIFKPYPDINDIPN